ncbi:MAG TPA: FAD-dependent oxidoreductase [Anaerovoracaceae bacterium]|nr:FAD-dependent oxidoreductase [Anaerovoracaceae bacterium]
MNNNYPHLFSPLKVGKLTFRNRIIATPGSPTSELQDQIAFYENKAKGGAACVTLGEQSVTSKYIVEPEGMTFKLDGYDQDKRDLASYVIAIKAYGAIPSVQFNHHGQFYRFHGFMKPPFVEYYPVKVSGYMPIGPSACINSDGVEVKEMDEDLIEETIEDFANAALFCKQAGFDMIQLHGAHGWLLAQFASGLFNHRKDRWGGSLENRARFPMEVIRRIRKKCGRDLVIEYRVSGDELVEGEMRIDETIEFIKMIEDGIDIVHVSAGIHMDFSTERRMFPQASFTEPGCNVYLAEAMKKNVKIPVCTVGGIISPEHAERIIAEGKADFIGMGRGLVCDPEFPNKARAGKSDKIIPCMRCSTCMSATTPWNTYNICCSANPKTGRDRMIQRIPAAKGSRKVVVAGGGPAGMMAAITAAERGHDVTLLEKSDALGGLLKFADKESNKPELKRYKDFLVSKTCKTVGDIRLNTEATPEAVEALNPGVLIAALGSRPFVPPIPGVDKDKALTVTDVYYNPEKLGQNVIIVGGGTVGCEAALYLAGKGKNVTIIEMLSFIADPAANWVYHLCFVEEIEKSPYISYMLETKCLEVTPKGVFVEKGGKQEEIAADSVVFCSGMAPETEALEGLYNSAPRVVTAGDCVKPARLAEGVRDGYFSAMNIL